MKAKVLWGVLLVLSCMRAQADPWDKVQEQAEQASEAVKDTAASVWEAGKASTQKWMDDTKAESSIDNAINKSKDAVDKATDKVHQRGQQVWQDTKDLAKDALKWTEDSARKARESIND